MTVVVGFPLSTDLNYQENMISAIYDQDCGTYSAKLSPQLDFVTVQTTGSSLTSYGWEYPDLITVSTSSLDDVGMYSITMTIFQDINLPNHGFTLPYVGVLSPVTYTFTVTIKPCSTVPAIDKQIETIDYIIGDPTFKTFFSFTQTPACGYAQTVELEDDVPDFLKVDADYLTFIYTSGQDLIGEYTINIKCTIYEPDETLTAFIERSVDYDFVINVLERGI